jgi:hypothetical protein
MLKYSKAGVDEIANHIALALVIWRFRPARSPASYHWAVASEIFLKTHAIAATEI